MDRGRAGVNTLACLKRIEKDVKADVKIYPLPHSTSGFRRVPQ